MEHGRVCQEHLQAFIDYLAFCPTQNCSRCHIKDAWTAFLYLLCELCATPLLYEHTLEQYNVTIAAEFNPMPFNVPNLHLDGASTVNLAKWLAKGGFTLGKAAEMFWWCRLVIHNEVMYWMEFVKLPNGEPNWFRLEKDIRVAACSHPATAQGQTYYYPPHPNPDRQIANGFSSPNEMDPPDAILEYCFKHEIDPSTLTEDSFVQLMELMNQEADAADIPAIVKPEPAASISNPLLLKECLGIKTVDKAISDLKFTKTSKSGKAGIRHEGMGPLDRDMERDN